MQVPLHVTDEVYDFLRIKCFERRQSMQDFIRQAINVQLLEQFGFEPSYQIGPPGKPAGAYLVRSHTNSNSATPLDPRAKIKGVLTGKSPTEQIDFYINQSWEPGELTVGLIVEKLGIDEAQVRVSLDLLGRKVSESGEVQAKARDASLAEMLKGIGSGR